MTAMDRWQYTARCPNCDVTGIVKVEELDGWSYMSALRDGSKFRWISRPPKGFIVYTDHRGNDAVKCEACSVKVPPS